MDDRAFWAIIDECRSGAGEAPAARRERLVARLGTLSDDEIAVFARYLAWMGRFLDTHRHRAAATLILGPLDEAAFADFRSWVVGLGEPWHRAVVADPEVLAELARFEPAEVDAAGDLAAVARDLFGRRTGRDLLAVLPAEAPPADPADVPLDLAESALRARFPRLAQRFAPSVLDDDAEELPPTMAMSLQDLMGSYLDD